MTPAEYERTLVLIKPDAMNHRDTIVSRIRNAGFTVVQSRILRLTPEQAAEFYRSRQLDPNYHALIVALTAGPIQAMCVSKLRALKELLWLIGPERYQDAAKDAPSSLRAMFADSRDDLRNAVHGSADADAAQFEIKFFFPALVLEPIFSEPALNSYLAAMVNPTLMEGLFLLAKERPREPTLWLSRWLLSNNPYKPKVVSALEEPIYRVSGVATEQEVVESEIGVSHGEHVGAQSQCQCNDYRQKGMCTCSLSTVTEIE